MDMTPQTWPEWYDGRHINEVLFCQQFLDKHLIRQRWMNTLRKQKKSGNTPMPIRNIRKRTRGALRMQKKRLQED